MKTRSTEMVEQESCLLSDVDFESMAVETSFKSNCFLPFRISGHLQSLISANPDPALTGQFYPSEAEEGRCAQDLDDPLGEALYSPLPRLVHRYPDRVLVLVTDQCAAYCRHCFRRSFTAGKEFSISKPQIGAILDYLKTRPQVHEVLFSGGDPLMLPDAELHELLAAFRAQSGQRVFRVATRMPVVDPERITARIVQLLAAMQPIWIVLHCNHRSEISPAMIKAVNALRSAGIPMLCQTVLLRGINDSVETLKDLFYGLIELGIKPYYLFQGDLAAGTARFRVNLQRGVELVTALRQTISGLAMPQFAVDLPGGGGKIPLVESYYERETATAYIFRSLEGQEYAYPKEDE